MGKRVVINKLFIWFVLLLCELEVGLIGFFERLGMFECVFLSVESIMFEVNEGVVVLIKVFSFWVLWL